MTVPAMAAMPQVMTLKSWKNPLGYSNNSMRATRPGITSTIISRAPAESFSTRNRYLPGASSVKPK
jgi:hypothetical protein